MSTEPTFDEVLAALLEAEDRGTPIDLAAARAQHPEHAAAIEAYFAAASWVADLAVGLDGEVPDTRPIEPPAIQGFAIVREIARGGMGVVFEAEQEAPRRRVALKALRDAALATEADVERFRREAQAAAELDHPGIVRILEVGASDQRIWYTMPLAPGGSLRTAMAKTVGQPRLAATLVRDIARAVAHGHARGILHRDLKPGNILLDARGAPLVADFGLARRMMAGNDPKTRTGTVLGTPAYMPPEQARGDTRAIDERTDIWSLGAILHELLSGRPPFVGDGPGDTIEQVLTREVPPLRSRAPNAPRDLATITDRCLRREPGDRYPSMRDLADDLDRALRGEAIKARPPGVAERVGRWIRRRALASALIAAALVAVVATALVLRGQRELQSESERRQARDHLATAWRLSEEGDDAGAAARFAAADGLVGTLEAKRGLLAHEAPVPLGVYPTRPVPLWRVAWDPAGQTLAAGAADGTLWVWDGAWQKTLVPHEAGVDVRGLAFHAVRPWLATGDEKGRLRIFDTATWTLHAERQLPPGREGRHAVLALRWVSNAQLTAGTANGGVHVWDVSANALRSYPAPPGVRDVRALCEDASATALVVAYGLTDGGAQLRRVALDTGALEATGQHLTSTVWDLAAHVPTGLLAAGHDTGIILRAGSPLALRQRLAHDAPVGAVAFGPGGRLVFSATVRGDVRAFDTTTGRQVGNRLRHAGQVYGIAVHPAGTRIAAVGMEGTLTVWRVPTGPPPRIVLGDAGEGLRAFAAPRADGSVLGLIQDPDGSCRATVWRSSAREPLASARLGAAGVQARPLGAVPTPGGWRAALEHPAPEGAAAAAQLRTAELDWADGALAVRLAPLVSKPGIGSVSLALEGDDVLCEQAHPLRTSVLRLGVEGRQSLHRGPLNGRCVLSRRGHWLLRVPAGARHRFHVERTLDGSAATAHEINGEVARAALSDDGRLAALALRDDRRVLVYDVVARRVRATLIHRDVHQLRVSLDGHVLITAGEGPRVRAWSTRTGDPVGRPLYVGEAGASTNVAYLELAVDDHALVAAGSDGRVVLFATPWLGPGLKDVDWPTRRAEAQRSR